jgi:hypothetical protein
VNVFREKSSLIRRIFGKKRLSFAYTSFTPPIRRKSGKQILFLDAWVFAKVYEGFCVGFTYTPDPAVIKFIMLQIRVGTENEGF